MIEVAETSRERKSSALRGLPVPAMCRPMPAGTGFFVATTVDVRGRVADRSPLRRLGWAAGSPVSFRVVEGLVVIVTPVFGGSSVTQQGHLRLPCTLRHRCRLSPGDRILVVVVHGLDRMEIYTPPAVDIMLLAYRQSLREYP